MGADQIRSDQKKSDVWQHAREITACLFIYLTLMKRSGFKYVRIFLNAFDWSVKCITNHM